MPDERTRNSVLRQLAALQNLSLAELQEKWRDLNGTEPPGYGAIYLKKRLAYRIQELFYGGLSDVTKEKIKRAAKPEADVRSTVLPGTRFLREWNGKTYEVVTLEKGFEFDGRKFRSLSAIASHITGTHWNGMKFFGLQKSGGLNV